ncbi:MAG: hypothetical protein ACO3UM_12100 [Planctomycetota bacterium]
MKNPLLSASLACVALAATGSAQVSMRLLGTVNLDSTSNPANAEFIGSNPAVVAWDGNDMWVAGFNSAGTTANVGIVQVSSPLTSPTYGVPFGVVAAPNLRGYSGLDITSGRLAAAYDAGGSDPQGIASYDAASGAALWAKAARGGSGVGYDPGFPGGNPAQGTGAAWTTFGSGRRALQDGLSGADIWTTSNGMIINTPEGTFWRDVDFDDATGDIFLREGNNVIAGTRTGDNSVTGMTAIYNPTDADFVNLQTVAYAQVGQNRVVFYNDRMMTSTGQAFDAVINAIDATGAPLTINWNGFSPATGNGAYDFSYDAASATMVILDFANRDAHVFLVSEDSGACVSFNDSNTTVSTGVTASPFVGLNPSSRAYQFTVQNPVTVLSASLFTGSPFRDDYMRLEVWDEDPNTGAPGNRLATGTMFSPLSTTAHWLGCNLSNAVSLTPGTNYWFAMIDSGGSIVPEEPNGLTPLVRKTRTAQNAWSSSTATGAAKFRLYCDLYPANIDTNFGAPCFTASGQLATAFSNNRAQSGDPAYAIEGTNLPAGSTAFLLLGYDPNQPSIPLGPFFPAGCFLNTNIFAVIPGQTGIAEIGDQPNSPRPSPFGHVRFTVPLTTVGAGVFLTAQIVGVDGSSTAAIPYVTSNAIRVTTR